MTMHVGAQVAIYDQSLASGVRSDAKPFWPYGWWKLVDYRIGIIPLPIYLMLLGLIAGFVLTGKVPGEISVVIALLTVGGFTCACRARRR